MTYFQRKVTLRLANVRFTRLNHDDDRIRDDRLESNSINLVFIQVFFTPFSANLTDQVACSKRIVQVAEKKAGWINQICFRRDSRHATLPFQQFDF